MPLRFTIRDLLWLTVVVALAVGWWLNSRSVIGTGDRNRLEFGGKVTKPASDESDHRRIHEPPMGELAGPQAEPPALSVQIKTFQQVYRVGDSALFNIEIMNTGSTVPARDMRVTLLFEVGLSPIRASKGAGLVTNGVEYSVAELRPGSRSNFVVECLCESATARACGSVTVIDTNSETPIVSEACVQIVAVQPAERP